MKKLTAGIFTVLMGLVTVNAAEAAVASKGYVDAKVGDATTAVTTLTQTVAQNKTDAAAATKEVADALASYQTSNNAAVAKNTEDIAKNATAIETEKTAREQADTALGGRLDTAESDITALQGEVGALSGEGEGSVAAKIAAAVAIETSARQAADTALQGKIDAINNEETGILKQAQTYADTAEADAIAAAAEAAKIYIDADELKASQDAQDAAIKTAYEAADKVITDSIGEVAEGKTVVEMIEAAQTAATYDDEEVRGLISDNAAAIATKLTDTATISEDGKYVLTAVTVGDDTTYAWELITRETGTEQE